MRPTVAAGSQHDELARLPSVDRLLNEPELLAAARLHGRDPVLRAVRDVIEETRTRTGRDGKRTPAMGVLALDVIRLVARWTRHSPRRVFNLTGTVLHTNLGRSPLPREALASIAEASGACSLEYDLDGGKRGERGADAEAWVRRLTGAEAALVVNNNAAAVFLVLNTLALRKEVPVSRGELVEIGGSFRMPDVMRRAGARLVEVGTTNRTHPEDYEASINPHTALLMKVRTSNFEVKGFTASVSDRDVADIAHRNGRLLFVDLGSGSLVDLRRFGLPHEPTPREALNDGADVVAFSGDKLLGGPQAGIIVGKGDVIRQLRRNPLLRALRLDKLRIAALGAVLRLYGRPDELVSKLPVLRLLARPLADIEATAAGILPHVARRLAGVAKVDVVRCESQVGSGAHPLDCLQSAGLSITPVVPKRAGPAALALAQSFRSLPIPVIGRVKDNALVLDVRCLEEADRPAFVAQLESLACGTEDPSRSTPSVDA